MDFIMCGIVGGIKIPKKYIKNLFIEAKDRGKDATGVAFFRDGKLVVGKKPIEATEFVETPEFDNFLKSNDTDLFIGHTRQKTQGDASNNKNNHPIFDRGVAIIHNGVISNYDDLIKRFNLKMKAEVDSEVILRLYLMFKKKHAPELAFNKTMEKIRVGAVAILDEDLPGKIMVGATSNNLMFAYLPDCDSIVFASSESIIKKSIVTNTLLKNYFLVSQQTESYFLQNPTTDRTFTIDPETGITEFKVTTEPYLASKSDTTFSWQRNWDNYDDKPPIITKDKYPPTKLLTKEFKAEIEAEDDDLAQREVEDLRAFREELDYEYNQIDSVTRKELNELLNQDLQIEYQENPNNKRLLSKEEREERLKEIYYELYIS